MQTHPSQSSSPATLSLTNETHWMSFEQAADHAEVSVRTIKRWISAGRVKHRKVRGRVQIDPRSLTLAIGGMDWATMSSDLIGPRVRSISVSEWTRRWTPLLTLLTDPARRAAAETLLKLITQTHGYKRVEELKANDLANTIRADIPEWGLPVLAMLKGCPPDTTVHELARSIDRLLTA